MTSISKLSKQRFYPCKFDCGNFFLLHPIRFSCKQRRACIVRYIGIVRYNKNPSFRFTQALSFTQFRGISRSQVTGSRADLWIFFCYTTSNSPTSYFRFVKRRKCYPASPKASIHATLPASSDNRVSVTITVDSVLLSKLFQTILRKILQNCKTKKKLDFYRKHSCENIQRFCVIA